MLSNYLIRYGIEDNFNNRTKLDLLIEEVATEYIQTRYEFGWICHHYHSFSTDSCTYGAHVRPNEKFTNNMITESIPLSVIEKLILDKVSDIKSYFN